MWKITGIEMLFLLLLAVCTWYDVKIRAVPRWLLIAGSALAAAERLVIAEGDVWIYAGGCMLGMLFLLFSRCSGEALGYADSWLIFSMGMHLGLRKLLVFLCVAFLAAGSFAAVLLVRNRQNRKTAIPFLPFLTIGYLGVIGWQG